MKKKILGSFLALGLAVGPLSGTPQETQLLAGQQPLRHDVAVILKLIQVYVVDRKGDPVMNLEKADFVLTDEGREMEITEFERHVLDAPAKEEAPAVAVAPPPSSPLLARKFIFLIDFARNDVFGVSSAKDAALRFLETRVRPSDEVALMTFRPFGGLVLDENLTMDHSRIREILGKIREIPGYGMGSGLPLLGEGGPESAGGGGLVTGWDPDWEQLKSQTYRFALVMQDLAKAMRYVPGFKNIIFFSSGVAGNILNDLEDSRVRREYEVMTRELATANCSVFTVNAEGQRAFLKDPMERGTDSLKFIAERSGGRYFHDVKQADEIASRIQGMTGNYYVLGYTLGEIRDGKFHEIRVTVRKPNCRVFTQEGYFNPEDFRKTSRIEKDLQLYDLALAERPHFQAPLRIPMTAVPSPARAGTDLLLLAAIDVDRMEEVLGETAEVVGLIFDDRNEIVFREKGVVGRKFLDPRDRIIYPYVLASLGPGEYKCRIVIRNLATGRGAVGAADVVVPESLPIALALHPPLMFVPDNPSFYLSLSMSEQKDAAAEIASLREAFPQITARLTPVLDALDTGISRLILVARYTVPARREEIPAFALRLVDVGTGETSDVLLSVVDVAQKGATLLRGEEEIRVDTLVAEIILPEAGPGRYRLVLEAGDLKTQTTVSASREITLR